MKAGLLARALWNRRHAHYRRRMTFWWGLAGSHIWLQHEAQRQGAEANQPTGCTVHFHEAVRDKQKAQAESNRIYF